MLKRLRDLLSSSRTHSGGAPHSVPGPGFDYPAERERHSLGLAQFFEAARDMTGLAILDLGEISQPSVTFITNLGHRLYSVDFVRTLDSMAAPGDPPGGPSQRNRMEAFLDQTLGFAPGTVDGALVWDALQFLSRPLLLATIERLHEILRPGASILALFHTAERLETVPLYSYRVGGPDTLRLSLRARRPLVETFHNRSIERLFEDFRSVRFFLTRDHLREVLVKR